MPKKKSSKKKTNSASRGSVKMSPIIQFGVVFVVVAAMFLLYYVGTLMK